MFTNNYIAFIHNRFWHTSDTTSPVNGITAKTFTGHDGTVFRAKTVAIVDIGNSLGWARCGTPSSYSPGVYFGSGSTPATKKDYNLENVITSGLSIANVGRGSAKEEDGRYCVFGMYNLTNTTDTEINICEIGFYLSVDNYNSGAHPVLMERTVLTEPITIQPGDEQLITYKMIFDQIVNPV